MIRRNSVIGAMLLSALCLCIFGAANAFAVKSIQFHECKKNPVTATAQTYTDAECKNKGAGEFKTEKLVGNLVLKSTQTSVFTLAATVAGVKFKIECSTLNGTGEGENTGEIATGKNIVEVFSGCKVTEPAGKGCTVPEKITTNKLKAETNEMKAKYTPASGETFVVITVSGCSVEALNGEKPVTGSASAVVQESAPTTGEFTSTSGSALKFGGQTATFVGNAHLATASNGVTVALETP